MSGENTFVIALVSELGLHIGRYFRLAGIMLLCTVVIYHMTDIDNFPLSPNYRFPFVPIAVASIVNLFIVFLIEWSFQFINRRYQNPRIKVKKFLIVAAIFSVVGLLLAYELMRGESWSLYNAIVSVLLTLGTTTFWIGIIYGKQIIRLLSLKNDKEKSIKIKSCKVTHMLSFSEIAYFESSNKIVVALLARK